MPQPLPAEPPRAADLRPSEGDVQSPGDIRLASALAQRRQTLTCLTCPVPLNAKLSPPILGAGGASPAMPPSNEPEREWVSAEHGVAAQPFTPKPNISSSLATSLIS
ncbi:hypothetical protein BGY98DRAFT_1175970 [Russula aff. rugulosa BPL654]|nr:hypothetical protein BGY98DRAFT_1175970 [Russula aff. rugulosa BPL654]